MSFDERRDLREQQGLPDIVILSDKLPRAKVPHICTWCGEEIRKGDLYWRLVMIFEGEFKQENICGICRYGG